ncbi:Homoserine dehydrogenase [Poriferisphaera corsica]|uniref:Homoserine dehydrogenase n=1 Tax=Poriferisphaera corsica TaxID=2528020 RepID=A0A517YUB0_9BACT|nr:homoserine dehydrogenase [Poriferisphaera corsica]QDU33811.1 Homoserine dehydrogenase [Poriferisphaera corsica]
MSDKPINIGIIGMGTVGGGVTELFATQAQTYAKRIGKPVQVSKVLVLNVAEVPADRKEHIADGVLTDNADDFWSSDFEILIELMGGTGAAYTFVKKALEAGKHIVTANKALLAKHGHELFGLAHKNNVSIAFEASCGGGIPCITALKYGLMANQIGGLYGILNGTCNYILTEMTQKNKTYDVALKEAQEKGFAEADPYLDVSGADTAQKLSILASLAFGVHIEGSQVEHIGVDILDLQDIQFGAELGYDIKLLGTAERKEENGPVSVKTQPCFVHKSDLIANVHGPMNALSVYGHAVGHTMYYGAGAGRYPTASAVVSDALNIASGWYGAAFAQMNLTPDCNDPAELVAKEDIESRYYLRFNALDVPGVIAKVTTILGNKDISIAAVMQHESNPGEFTPIVITTHDAKQGDLDSAITEIEALKEIDGNLVSIRIAEFASDS